MTTITDPFNYRTPVKTLYNDFTDAKPINYDWSEGWPDTWDYMAADECPECGNVIAGTSECGHRDNQADPESDGDTADCQGTVYLEGPMMNYYYPVEFKRVGGIVEAAIALRHLPLVPVTIGDDEAMALSGGGMDLSPQIVEAYMRLGYLPPVHFANLPQFGGEKLTARWKWILSGMNRSIDIERQQMARSRKRLRDLRQWLTQGGK